jgi:hypothetical protein
LKYNKRLICEYTGVDDQLRATKDNLPTDSLNKRIRTLVKLTRGQEVPEINEDMYLNNTCPSVRFALSHFAGKAEEDPEDEEDEEEEAPKKKLSLVLPNIPVPRFPKLMRNQRRGLRQEG